MSGISGVNPNFGFESLAAAMSKRALDDQGKAAMSLLQGATQSVQQIQSMSSSNGHIDTYA